jgi:hypothetical protein
MKYFPGYLVLIILLGLAPAVVPAPNTVISDPTVLEMLSQVSQSRLLDNIKGLSGMAPVPVGGSFYAITTRATRSGTSIGNATQYAWERFQAAGLVVNYQYWSSSGYSGRNVIAQKDGTTKADEIVLITAHIDDLPSSGVAPGADDDATGCEAVMTAAELMVSHDFERTVRFILFTGEEQGYLGSQAYASSVVNENIVCDLQLEMLGWDASGLPTMQIYTRKTSDPGYAADQAIANTMAGVISTYALPLVPKITASGRTDSDHASFWRRGMAAVVASQDAESDFNPYYHTSQDNADKLNLQRFTNLVKASLGTAAHLAIPFIPCVAPTVPANLIATADSNTAINLSWSAVPDAAEYRIFRSLSSGGPYVAVVSTPDTTYTNDGLIGNTTYYYLVRSVRTAGSSCESADSNEAWAMTAPPPPAPTATLAANPGTIQQGQSSTLTWQTTNAAVATISGLGMVALNGSQVVTPSGTTTYQLSATGTGGTATAATQVTVMPAAGTQSESEPNNSISQADPVAASGTTIVGTIDKSTDSDYFGAMLPAKGTLVVDLTVPANKNYDIRIYNSRGITLASGSRGTGQAEHVTYRNTGTQSMAVYIRIYGYGGAYSTTPYQLKLSW